MPDELNPLAASLMGNGTAYQTESDASAIEQQITNPYLRGLFGDGAVNESARKLHEARRRHAGEDIGLLQSYKRSYAPFGDLYHSDLPTLSQRRLPSITVGGYTLGGQRIDGRTVGTREYGEAVQRFNSGVAGEQLDKDVETIALYERHQEIDKEVRDEANFAQRVALELGSLGKIGGEAVAGGMALSKAVPVGGAALSRLRGGAAAAAPAAAPALTIGSAAAPVVAAAAEPVAAAAAPSVLRQAASYAGSRALTTAVTPSLYVGQAQQKNLEMNREANKWQGYVPALAYGYANMLVLGQLQKGIRGNLVTGSLKKGVLGTTELTLVDSVAELVDRGLPKEWQTGAKSNVSKWVGAYLRGDPEAQRSAASDAAVQVVSFGLFAALHGRESAGKDLIQAYSDAADQLVKKGSSKDAAATELIEKVNKKIEAAMESNPDITREEVAKAVEKVTGPAADYANEVVKAFAPPVEPNVLSKATAAPEPPAEAPPKTPTGAPPEAPPEAQPKTLPLPSEAPPEVPPEAPPAPPPEAPPQAATPVPPEAAPTVPPAASRKGPPLPPKLNKLVSKAVAIGEEFGSGTFLRELQSRLGLSPEQALKLRDAIHERGLLPKATLQDLLKGTQTESAGGTEPKGKAAGKGVASDATKQVPPGGEDLPASQEKLAIRVKELQAAEKAAIAKYQQNPSPENKTSYEAAKQLATHVSNVYNQRAKDALRADAGPLDANTERDLLIAIWKQMSPAERNNNPDIKAALLALGVKSTALKSGRRYETSKLKLGQEGELPQSVQIAIESSEKLTQEERGLLTEYLKGASLEATGIKFKLPKSTTGRRLDKAFNTLKGETRIEAETLKSWRDSLSKQGAQTAAEVSQIGSTRTTGAGDVAEQLNRDAIAEAARVTGRLLLENTETGREFQRLESELKAESQKAEPDEAKLNDVRSAMQKIIAKEMGSTGSMYLYSVIGLPINFKLLSSLSKTLFGDLGFKAGISRLFKKYFTAAGLMPDSARTATVARDGKVQMEFEQVAYSIKDFHKAVSEVYSTSYKNLPDNVRANLNLLLGDQTALSAVKANPTMAHPQLQTLFGAIENMRNHIDRLSKRLIQNGAVQGPLAALIGNNLGVYLTLSYRVFTDPAWADKVDVTIKNAYKAWLRNEMQAAINRATGPKQARLQAELNATDFDAKVNNILTDGTAAENPLAFLTKHNLNRKDLTSLTARKNLSPELRALLGEVTDPVANYALTIGKLAHLTATHEFLAQCRSLGLAEGWLSPDRPTGKNDKLLAEKDDKTMAPLNGLYTTGDIKSAFVDAFSPKTTNQFMAHWMKFVGLAKYSHVVLNPMTVARSFLSSALKTMSNGHYQLWELKNVAPALFKDTPANRAKWLRWAELGLTGDSVYGGEMRQVAKDMQLDYENAADFQKTGEISDSGAWQFLKKAYKQTAKWYNNTDTVFRIMFYERELKDYKKAYPQWSQEQAEQHASGLARKMFPTYSEIGTGVKSLRGLPIAPFASYHAESVRTTWNSVAQAFKELRDPVTRSIGARRLGGLMAAGSASLGFAAFSRYMSNMTYQDEKDMRRLTNNYDPNSRYFHLERNPQTGDPRYIDMSRTDPYAYLTDAITAALRGKDPQEAAKFALAELLRPYYQPDILSKAVVETIFNAKLEGGTVANPQITADDRAFWAERFKHLAKAFEPGVVAAARKVGMGMIGAKEQKSGRTYNWADELAGATTGQKPTELRRTDIITNRAKEFNKNMNESARIVDEMIKAKGDVTDAELRKAIQLTEVARRRAFDNFREDLLAAERLGLSRKTMNKLLYEAEVSEEMRARLFKGVYAPLEPTPLATRLEVDRNKAVRKMLKESGGTAPPDLEKSAPSLIMPGGFSMPIR